MTTQTMRGEDFFAQLLKEANKQIDEPQRFQKTEIKTIENKYLFKFIKFIIHNLFLSIKWIYKLIISLIIYICKLYKPSVFFTDKYFSLFILEIFKKINYSFLVLRSYLEKYIKRKKYDTL